MTKKVEKTIIMKSAAADKWLTALRSEEFKQDVGTLQSERGYCCLGVLQCVLGKVQKGKALPSRRWLKDHDIIVAEERVDFVGGRDECIDIRLNPPVKFKGNSYESVSDLNDGSGANFRQIANILDKRIKRV